MTLKPYVLSIDPGMLSGVCLVETGPLRLVESDELEWLQTARFVDQKLRELGGDQVAVVVEKFTITAQTGKKSQQPWSLEITGMCRLLSAAHEAGAIVQQTPADAKSFVSNARLRQLDLWHVGGGGHALDAMRHAVLFMARNDWKDERLLLR